LRIAAILPGQIQRLCIAAGLTVSIKHIRIGRLPMAKLAPVSGAIWARMSDLRVRLL
jgi:hypothetical protein